MSAKDGRNENRNQVEDLVQRRVAPLEEGRRGRRRLQRPPRRRRREHHRRRRRHRRQGESQPELGAHSDHPPAATPVGAEAGAPPVALRLGLPHAIRLATE